jgi:hypothetical protein
MIIGNDNKQILRALLINVHVKLTNITDKNLKHNQE